MRASITATEPSGTFRLVAFDEYVLAWLQMTTLAEIESAVKTLPRRQQETLLRHLSRRLESEPSCYDLAKDLFEKPGQIGASGKRDLSTNKKYLANFGRAVRVK